MRLQISSFYNNNLATRRTINISAIEVDFYSFRCFLTEETSSNIWWSSTKLCVKVPGLSCLLERLPADPELTMSSHFSQISTGYKFVPPLTVLSVLFWSWPILLNKMLQGYELNRSRPFTCANLLCAPWSSFKRLDMAGLLLLAPFFTVPCRSSLALSLLPSSFKHKHIHSVSFLFNILYVPSLTTHKSFT